MILDERFEKFLEGKMGQAQFKKLSKKSRDSARRYWQETVKPTFIGRSVDEFENCDWAVPLPGAKDNRSVGLEGGFLLMDR